jgi:molecular chaperone GrpE (heat shock protein)
MSGLKLPKWPFFVADGLFLVLAALIVGMNPHGMSVWLATALFMCVASGAAFCVYPFVADHQAALKLAEMDGFASTIAQIQKIEQIAEQIGTATGHWQSALDQSAKTVTAASEIATRMEAEARSFADFMQKANDSEKAHLRLEVDKLRRSEAEWLQVLVRIFDHVYALNQAGVKSGQHALIQNLGNFQNACRDVTRRVGLVPFVAAPDEEFDKTRHQTVEGGGGEGVHGPVLETLATGYSYQGQLIRRALVALRTSPMAAPAPATTTVTSEVTPSQPVVEIQPGSGSPAGAGDSGNLPPA